MLGGAGTTPDAILYTRRQGIHVLRRLYSFVKGLCTLRQVV